MRIQTYIYILRYLSAKTFGSAGVLSSLAEKCLGVGQVNQVILDSSLWGGVAFRVFVSSRGGNINMGWADYVQKRGRSFDNLPPPNKRIRSHSV